jgi:hypothetical protein
VLAKIHQEVPDLLRGPRPGPASDHAEDVRITTMQYERCRARRSPIAGYRLLDIDLHSFMM